MVLTNMCNLSCTFCFQERKKRADRMTTQNWIDFINQIPKNSRIDRDPDFWTRYAKPTSVTKLNLSSIENSSVSFK